MTNALLPVLYEYDDVIGNVKATINLFVDMCHEPSRKAGWWNNKDGTPKPYWQRVTELPTRVALIHSELSEGLEGDRKQMADDHLPQFPMAHVEVADALIRLFDMAGGLELDITTQTVQRCSAALEASNFRNERYSLYAEALYSARNEHLMVDFANGFTFKGPLQALTSKHYPGSYATRIAVAHAFVSNIINDFAGSVAPFSNIHELHPKDYDAKPSDFPLFHVGRSVETAIMYLLQVCDELKIPIFEIIPAKLDYNASRADHKPENRAKKGGKAY